MEKHGYSYCCAASDWTVSLPGNGAYVPHGPCFSVPASRLYIGKILWIAGMFECAVKHAVHKTVRRVFRLVKFLYTRVSVRKVTCCFKL